ncbi:ras and Rab interactor 2-like isoform X2 [Siniperca chuatsi]|uniref:ras and Rab interactor 2-like isoform X2 n=1 Tax=Siniperca chuatsi TaxID=119488 RepID=UPI001CE0F4D6|nr:ras and Rab interactor 2-like isoform X2 [Siniperca chuatsi]
MAQQDEPLYDFPEPSQLSERKFLGHQRGRASLRSISVLDRLLLTVPVWLQLSINPATALHIMQREPPGAFLVRKSRTSKRNVLCVRLADDSVPSFVQQFGIREEHSTLSLEASSISFPDLPRLISFYCVSRDVLPFPLELPEAIAKATSHKELESISHMGIEFWSSQLNVRGPREAPKLQKDKEKKPDTATSTPPAAAPQTSSAAQPDSAPQPDSDNQLKTAPESDAASKKSVPDPTLFHEFCPITTRSPRELDCGSGQGDLCFINPLFLQSQNTLCRRRMFKHSLKVRVSTETSTMLSPPLAPPPPPPLMPKTKGKCRAPKRGQGTAHPSEGPGLLQGENPSQATQIDPTVQDTGPQPLTQTQMEPGLSKAGVMGEEATAQLPTVTEHLADESDYMQPSPMINFSHSPSLSPYRSPSVPPMVPPLFPKVSPSHCPHDSPNASPSLSPYQSPSSSPMAPPLFPKVSQSRCPHDSSSASPSPYQSPSSSPMAPPLFPKVSPSCCPHDSRSASPSLSPCQSPYSSPKVLFSLSPHDSPSASPSLSPHQSPSPSPKVPFSLSPFTSPCFSQLVEQAYHTPATSSRLDQQRSEREAEEEGAGVDENEDEDNEELQKKREEEERGLVLQMNAASLNDTDSCSSFSSLEGAAETPPHLPHKQNNGTNILDCN